MTLEARPMQPTIRMILGWVTSCGSTKRWMASRKIETQRATRKTPFTRAPSVSARCHCSSTSAVLCYVMGLKMEDATTYTVCIHLRVRLLVGYLDGPQANTEREDIIQLQSGISIIILAHTDRSRDLPCGMNPPQERESGQHILESRVSRCERET